MTQKSLWKTRAFPNEVGSIGEKLGKIWLENNGYKVYSYQGIIGLVAELKATRLRMKRRIKNSIKKMIERVSKA